MPVVMNKSKRHDRRRKPRNRFSDWNGNLGKQQRLFLRAIYRATLAAAAGVEPPPPALIPWAPTRRFSDTIPMETHGLVERYKKGDRLRGRLSHVKLTDVGMMIGARLHGRSVAHRDLRSWETLPPARKLAIVVELTEWQCRTFQMRHAFGGRVNNVFTLQQCFRDGGNPFDAFDWVRNYGADLDDVPPSPQSRGPAVAAVRAYASSDLLALVTGRKAFGKRMRFLLAHLVRSEAELLAGADHATRSEVSEVGVPYLVKGTRYFQCACVHALAMIEQYGFVMRQNVHGDPVTGEMRTEAGSPIAKTTHVQILPLGRQVGEHLLARVESRRRLLAWRTLSTEQRTALVNELTVWRLHATYHRVFRDLIPLFECLRTGTDPVDSVRWVRGFGSDEINWLPIPDRMDSNILRHYHYYRNNPPPT